MLAGRLGGGGSTATCGTGSGTRSGTLGRSGGGRVSLNKSRPLLLYSVRRLASSFQRCSAGFSTGSGRYAPALNDDVLRENDGPLLSKYKTPITLTIRAGSTAMRRSRFPNRPP